MGAGDAGRGEMDGSAALALLAALPDLVATIDMTGLVLWMNDAGWQICGREPDELGSLTVWDLLAPEEQQLAAQGMLLTATGPGLVIPGEYGIVRPDGSIVRVETMGAVAELDGEARLVVVARSVAHRMTDEFDGLIHGAPFADLVGTSVGRMRDRWIGHLVTMLYTDLDGTPVLVGEDLPDAMRPTFVSDDCTLPWERAIANGVEQYAPVEDLPDPVATVARAHGCTACIVVPLPDPLGEPACLLVWRTEDAPVDLERLWTRAPAFLLLRLALERRGSQASLESAARTDPLTGLANRAEFFGRIESPERPRTGQAVVYIDLDNFKPVNDAHGHRTGDALLVEFARRLRIVTRDNDVVARMGGDEFAVLMSSVASTADVTALADRILAALDEPFAVDGIEATVHASIGIAVDLSGSDPTGELVDRADTAMYAAKRSPDPDRRWRLAPDLG